MRIVEYFDDRNNTKTGWFHAWGIGMIEGEFGFGNYSVAIIERQDGTVVAASPQRVRFLQQPKEEEPKVLQFDNSVKRVWPREDGGAR